MAATLLSRPVSSARDQKECQTFYNGMGGWRWGGFGETTTQAVDYPVGTLVLDLCDCHSKQLIWRGTAQDSLSDKPEKDEKKMDKAVEKCLTTSLRKRRGRVDNIDLRDRIFNPTAAEFKNLGLQLKKELGELEP